MNKLHSLVLALLAAVALLVISPDDAFAKRLGGGRSFGSSPSYSESYRPSPGVAPGYRAPQSAYQAPQRNQALRDSFRNRGGFMGMLGGLALGGLLGSMLFGGAFEHINLLDFLVLGVAAYLLFRFFAARRRGEWGPQQGDALGSAYPDGRSAPGRTVHDGRGELHGGARFDTDVLFREGRPSGMTASQGIGAGSVRPSLPPGFDAGVFLAAAKNAYRHLQAAWDEGDLAELRALTTQSVFDELRQQLQQRAGANHTDVLSLDATLLEVQAAGGELRTSVLFEAVLREAVEEAPQTFREVWHFVRDQGSRQPTWYLDGIQQTGE